jgi:MFS family permease
MTISSELDRRNGWIFLINFVLIYLAAPVVYVGVIQAALCNKLGASATVANLPASTYLLGQVSPLFFSWLVPHRHEQNVVIWANGITALLLASVALTLVLPTSNEARIGAVVLQGLLQGLSSSVSLVFMVQCLRRGTTSEGRALALKRTYTVGPIAAVAGSLGAQYMLGSGHLTYPFDFAFIYAIGTLCTAGVAVSSAGFRLPPISEEARGGIVAYLRQAARDYIGDRQLLRLWIAYGLWYCTLGGISNLSLFTRQAVGRDPKDLSGVILAIRFGCKAVAGYFLGLVATRSGMRPAVLATVWLVGAGMLWAWLIPGYGYLFAFGLLGAGELGGIYFPNLVASLSTVEAGTRNLAILTLATPASSFAPALHGYLTDAFGFQASFAFGILTATLAIALLISSPKRKENE